ncbi:MAG: inorganic phosphate transporter [Promethearchaeota archaeon]|nr:MAG: inorganic phosphate transporter [Candidatus Lokiarchaeota archaeon]
MNSQLGYVLIIVLVIMGFSLAFSIGANDETLSALVGANVLKFRVALIVGGLAAGLGMILFSQGVGKTVGADILGSGLKYTTYMLLAVLISSIIWLIIGSFAGIPLSSTHSTIGSIFGVVIIFSIFHGGVTTQNAFNNEVLVNVVLGWFLSPLFGLLITYILFKVMAKFYLSNLKGLNQIEKSEKNFSWLLLIAVIFAEIWVGANSAECVGIFYGLLDNGSLTLPQYYFFVVLCGVFVFFGIFIAGRYVIRNLASQMTDARPSEGFIIQLSSAIILMICTMLSLPISHSHVIVFCIIGLNLAQNKEVDSKAIIKMTGFWILTFPIAAIMAGMIYFGFISFGLY